jgi:hypothetical protein
LNEFDHIFDEKIEEHDIDSEEETLNASGKEINDIFDMKM